MSNVVHLKTSNGTPAKRACGTCKHVRGSNEVARCTASGRSIFFERQDPVGACGTEGKLWEKKVRIGLVGWVKRLLFGDAV